MLIVGVGVGVGVVFVWRGGCRVGGGGRIA